MVYLIVTVILLLLGLRWLQIDRGDFVAASAFLNLMLVCALWVCFSCLESELSHKYGITTGAWSSVFAVSMVITVTSCSIYCERRFRHAKLILTSTGEYIEDQSVNRMLLGLGVPTVLFLCYVLTGTLLLLSPQLFSDLPTISRISLFQSPLTMIQSLLSGAVSPESFAQLLGFSMLFYLAPWLANE